MSGAGQAKFFVNSGLVSSPADIYNLLRPLLRQTVAYRYLRGASVVATGTGWVEKLVLDRPGTSTFFTPLSVCINVDSWEHLEFETRTDQLLTYTLVQGDERVVIEFAQVERDDERPEQQTLRLEPAVQYIQMTLAALDTDELDGDLRDEADEPDGAHG